MNVLNPTASLVYDRIEKLAPEYVRRIMTYLSNQLPGEYMSQLASAPDKLIQEIVSVAKFDLQLLPPKLSSPVISPPAADPRWDSDPLDFCHGNVPSHYQQLYAKQQPEFAVPPGYLELQSQPQNQFLPSSEQVEKVALGELEFTVDYLYNKELEQHLNGRVINRRHSNISDYPVKICHYFSRGYCKHGNNCRYLHVQASRDGFSPILGPFLNDGVHDDQIFSPGSLEKLELEIVEILKSRSGNPLSIATLPTVYYEKYRKVLQAEGYLTESQRQGKSGHSLTRLLSRLGSIRLIDRPHGQHAVVLAEDAMKYFEGRYEGSPVNSSSRQIYLTFPAESTFSEEDVSKYFSNYGLVEDVRIPCQQKRMFGFVTFVDPEIPQKILAKGNPHYVCGARVLVKPYKEKSKLIDRKYQERTECRSQHVRPYMDADSELHSAPRGSETSRLLRRQQFMDRHVQALEFERSRRLAQLQLVREHYQQQQQHYLVNSMNALKISEGHSNVLSANSFNYLVDVLNNSSAEDNKVGLKETINPDHERDVLNLQDSTFAASIVNSVIN